MHLKTIGKTPQRFAVLLRPESKAKNDLELVRDIKAYGSAVLGMFKDGTFEHGETVTITPEEFHSTWIGD